MTTNLKRCEIPKCNRKTYFTFKNTCKHSICDECDFYSGLKCTKCDQATCGVCIELGLYKCGDCEGNCMTCFDNGFFCSLCKKQYCDNCVDDDYETCGRCNKSYCDTIDEECALIMAVGKFSEEKSGYCNRCCEHRKKKKKKKWGKRPASEIEESQYNRENCEKFLGYINELCELNVPKELHDVAIEFKEKIKTTPEYKKMKFTVL